MGYRFCLGASGAGKSKQLYTWASERAREACDRLDFSDSYMIVVPDQYTMQTQKDLVMEAGKRGGILNVDVLSFGRLSHRIFEELGADPRGVLDDMGKTLLLRRIATKCGKQLSVLQSGLERPGMIAEVKSVLSEFMQYGLHPSDVGELAVCAGKGGQGSLCARLRDLRVLYEAFLEERKERYITGEETLDLLAQAIPRSRLAAESTVIFDGFTGFTPVQNRVLLALMQTAREVIIALDYDSDGGTPIEQVMDGAPFEEQDLFYLSRKTVASLTRMADKAGVPREETWYIGGQPESLPSKPPRQEGAASGRSDSLQEGETASGRSDSLQEDEAASGRISSSHKVSQGRFACNPALAHLEKSLFRYPVKPYRQGLGAEEKKLQLHILLSSNPEEEVRQVFLTIRELMEREGYHYRDFAIVTGDLSSYAEEISIAAKRYGIPVYLDANRAVLQNPLTESIRSALEIGGGDYSYETVFRFLRSGLSGLQTEDIDRLENYCLKRGIASRRRWETCFDEEFEDMRQVFLQDIRPLQELGHATARERSASLYRFLTGLRAGEQLEEAADRLEAAGDTAAAMEYRQIYAAVIRLLDEIYELLGDEAVSAGDFLELVEAGFAEIRLGTLPQQVDRILAGDMERTRLSQIRVLFFLGVNDGIIPGNSSKGGLLSDFDREFLQESEAFKESGGELAPTPRQEMYMQRLYLYMNLTKPTDLLYVSYAKMSADGSSLRPSYLIALLQQLFPKLRQEIPEERPLSDQLLSPGDAAGFLSGALRQYADGRFLQDASGEENFLTLYGICLQSEKGEERAALLRLREAAFAGYTPKPLSQKTARLLYQGLIKGSVTRLETAAGCYLRHFLRYGLQLREREMYTFEANDSGTILHESVQRFGQLLRERGISWTEYTREQGSRLVQEALQEKAGSYREQVLYATERGACQLQRMQRALEQTVDALQYQLQSGDFRPAALEQSFGRNGELQYPLPEGKLVLEGRIDRVDLAREDERIYIKILDYKSGHKELETRKIAAGLQLQLPLYMEAERRLLERKNPAKKIIPAAMLYHRFDDPMLQGKESEKVLEEARTAGEEKAEEKKRDLLREKLRPTGYVGAERDILEHLDHSLGAGAGSQVIPVRLNKDGSPRAGSRTLTAEEWKELTDRVQEAICTLSSDILKGRVDANPVELDSRSTFCTYCPYQDSCGFDKRLPGYEYRTLQNADIAERSEGSQKESRKENDKENRKENRKEGCKEDHTEDHRGNDLGD